MVFSQETTSTHRNFIYEFVPDKGAERRRLKLLVNIAEDVDCEELTARVAQFHKIPCYLEDEFCKKLSKFIQTERTKYTDEKSDQLLENFRKKQSNVAKVSKTVAEKYHQWWCSYGDGVAKLDTSRDFSFAFHKLIHSSCMTLLFQLQQGYFKQMEKVSINRSHSLLSLAERQAMEMERIGEHLGDVYTEENVHSTTTRHLGDTERLEEHWKTKVDELATQQKTEYHDIVKNLYNEMLSNNGNVDEHGSAFKLGQAILDSWKHIDDIPQTFSDQPTDTFQSQNSSGEDLLQPVMEESFTVNLGAQLKTMHNIRLIVDDMLNFCRHSKDSSVSTVQQLQTIMSLYSSGLSGMVLLMGDCVIQCNSTPIKREFTSVCENSTEFHFNTFTEQFETIRSNLEEQKLTADKLSVKSGDTESVDSNFSINSQELALSEGDFIVTKHSNLSKAHVAFHMATEPAQLSASAGGVSSRHPVILGLRHILKVMSSHDIETLSIPLLLTHDLHDNMSPSWIHKRADLVMKCVKGFMMEMATWDGGISRTIQFILPNGIDEDMFDQLRKLLPSIFRTTSVVTHKPVARNNGKATSNTKRT